MAAPKREHLLQTAANLFSKEGFKGVSVDRLLREAGVAKMTLYKGFESKEALIRETLHRRAQELSSHVDAVVQKSGSDPQDRLLSVFDAMALWAERPDFNGCYFINALGEYGATDTQEARIARSYKAAFLEKLEVLCHACDPDGYEELARIVYILIDGATMARLTLHQSESFARAKSVVRELLAARRPTKQHDR